MKHIKVSLPTIHCQSCVKTIILTLNDISGIVEKAIDLDQKEAHIRFDPTLTSAESIIAMIKNDAGYEAILTMEEDEENGIQATIAPPSITLPKSSDLKPSSNTQIAIFEIEGMHCASCAGLIEKSIKKVAGVEEVNVNFASEKAHIKYQPARVSIPALESMIASA